MANSNKHFKTTPKIYTIFVSDEIKLSTSVSGKQKRPVGRGFLNLGEFFSGFQPSKDKNKYPEGVDRFMNIDREKDWYDEKVIDKKTGKIVREWHGELSKHRGRGSAKYSNILKRAKQKWNNDYEMVKHEYKKQVEAYEWINQQTAHPEIMTRAKQKWGDNYEMVKYEYEKQVKAYEAL